MGLGHKAGKTQTSGVRFNDRLPSGHLGNSGGSHVDSVAQSNHPGWYLYSPHLPAGLRKTVVLLLLLLWMRRLSGNAESIFQSQQDKVFSENRC